MREERLVDGTRVHLLIQHVLAHTRFFGLAPLLLCNLTRELLLAAEDLALARYQVAPHRLREFQKSVKRDTRVSKEAQYVSKERHKSATGTSIHL